MLWLLLLITASHAKQLFRARCEAFVPETYVYNSSRHVLEYIPAGTNLSLPDNDPTCARPNQTTAVDLCRVALLVPTTNRSSISFELWLPDNWTGRFLATGNGGIDGCIKYEDLAYTTQHGFASVGSNNGHNGTTLKAMYWNLDVVTDYSWRSLHISTVVGKKLTNLFYNRPHSKTYYIGCSLGGRQGIDAADMFPGDFDGIIAGSPALDFNNLQSWRASFFTITGSNTSSYFISASTWINLIHKEILEQCDHLDGVNDSIIEDPNLCHFRPETLLCTHHNPTSCLTAKQVAIVREVLSPLYGENGNLIYPAMQPGSEVKAATQLYAGIPFSYSNDWFKYVVYNPSWNASTFNLHDAAVAKDLNPANIRTWPRALSHFKNRGGKMATYHGLQDERITSYNTQRFYEHLSQGMQASPQDLDAFFRFFRVPGMSHCQSGPGAWVIGQGGGVAKEGIAFDPSYNVLAAMVQWVEEGVAPEDIVGTKFVDDNVASGVEYHKRHCRYPLRSTYRGGDETDLKSWECL